MEKLNAKITKVIFKNDDNFIIAATNIDKIIKGNVFEEPSALVDQEICFTGEWQKNEKFGEQFAFSSYELKADYTMFFLATMVKGITNASAKEICEKFGAKFGEIVEKDPKRLLSIKGIGEVKMKDIVESYKNSKHLRALADFLLPYDVTPNAIGKIYNQFKEASIVKLKENPYILTSIRGVGFKKTDEIALKIGIKENDIHRIKSAILYSFDEHCNNGHTLIDKNTLMFLLRDLLETESFKVSDMLIESAISLLSGEGLFMKFPLPYERDPHQMFEYYTSKKLLNMEMFIYQYFKDNANESTSTVIESDINNYIKQEEARIGFSFSDKQKEIIKLANQRYRIISLSGYAGAGKTTSAQSVLRLYSKICNENEIVCCALSGVAANRAKTVTGYQGYTLHSLLKFGVDGFEYNKDNKLPYKLILLDEASMVDTYLFYSLLQAIDSTVTTLIIAGDPAQLQSVGSGDVYAIILLNKLCHGVVLDKVYRQTESQAINIFAQSIRQGEAPANILGSFEDLKFINTTPPNYYAIKKSMSDAQGKEFAKKVQLETLEQIKMIAAGHLTSHDVWAKDIWKYITHFQVITPMNQNTLGVENLNIELQKIFNGKAHESEIKVFSKVFRPRDKVMHLKNEWMQVVSENTYKTMLKDNLSVFDSLDEDFVFKQRVFNGQFGVILKIEGDKIAVYYPNEKYIAMYAKKDLSSGMISHSYAISIHKSQGSQFDNVVLPMSMSHFIMLNNKLQYTSLTRAKNMCYLVGEKSAFEMACKNVKTTKRETVLGFL